MDNDLSSEAVRETVAENQNEVGVSAIKQNENENKNAEERFNPFDAFLLETLHRSNFSPSIFARVVSPSSGDSPVNRSTNNLRGRCRGFRWSIDHIAALNPAQIDETEVLLQEHCGRYDDETEARIQSAINQFFNQPLIAPSPWASSTSSNGSASSPNNAPIDRRLPLQLALLRSQQKQKTHPHLYKFPQNIDFTPSPLCAVEKRAKIFETPVDVSCQTMITFPPDFDLSTILGPKFFTTDQSISAQPTTTTSATTQQSSGLELWNSNTNNSSVDINLPKSKSFSTKASTDQGILSFSTLRRKLFRADSSCGSDDSNKSRKNSLVGCSSSSSNDISLLNNTQNVENDLEAEFGNAKFPTEDGDSSVYLLSSSPVSGNKRSPSLFFQKSPARFIERESRNRSQRTSLGMAKLSSPEISPIKDSATPVSNREEGACNEKAFSGHKKEKKKPPKPPVPNLTQTLNAYLEYARVLAVDDEQYQLTKSYVDEFAQLDGPVLQDELEALAEEKDNWINEFWLGDMYLNNRVSLPVFSNPGYVFPDQKFASNEDMVRYASHFICGVYHYKDKLDRRELPIDKSTGKDGGHPLCMEQYWRLFTSYRLPAHPVDQLDMYTNREMNGNEHIVVLCNNHFFQLETVINGERISQLEINKQLSDVLDFAKAHPITAAPIGLVTAVNRDRAALARSVLEQDPVNKSHLEVIKSASFLVVFDKPTPGLKSESNIETQLAARATHMLHGHGVTCNTSNRWFNKTMQFIFAPDGACGMNYEHSVAEGIAVINMVEETVQYAGAKMREKIIGAPRLNLKPKPLVWNVSPEMHSLLDDCKEETERLVGDLDFVILDYHGFGKEFPKSKCMSPDAFIQVTLQLTHYRCHGRLVSTYESATTRRFRQGRVDNIRAATPEALAWVTAMEDSQIDSAQKKEAFRAAIEKQTKIMYQNITGYGIDNHIVALRDLAKKHLPTAPEMFTDPLFDQLFRFPLSTSQVPTRIPYTFMCYGPVVADGYGCGYNPHADRIIFIISSMRSCPKTDSTRFRNVLEKTLDDMKEFL